MIFVVNGWVEDGYDYLKVLICLVLEGFNACVVSYKEKKITLRKSRSSIILSVIHKKASEN